MSAPAEEGKTTMVQISPVGLSTDIISKAQPKLRPFENSGKDDFANQLTNALGQVAKALQTLKSPTGQVLTGQGPLAGRRGVRLYRPTAAP